MIKSYFKIAWRNLAKNKTFSLINITGLTLGVSCSLLIMLWVNDERSINAFHKNANQLYTVFERQYHDGIVDAGYNTPGVLADEMKVTLPEVALATPLAWNQLNTFEANNKILKQTGNYTGADFFSMFSYPFLLGDPLTALKSPVDIVISRKMAEDFFGSTENAYGQSILFQNRKNLKITGIFENFGPASSYKVDYLINWQTFVEDNAWVKDWGNHAPQTFLMLRPGTDVSPFKDKIRNFISLYYKDENFRIELDLQPYKDQYLYGSFKDGEIHGGRIQYVILFTVVAVFILLIACINFMNLSTARSAKRAKEIGIRKVVGAGRGALIRQFLSEALLTVLFAFGFALMVVALLLPAFNNITQKQIDLPFTSVFFWGSFILLVLLTAFISGGYPALFLSSLKPVGVLKGALKFSTHVTLFRKSLVVFQFALSILLIVGTIVVSRQVTYVQSVNLGYDRQNLIYVPLEGALAEKYEVFKDELLTRPGIQTITRMSQTPTAIQNGTGGVVWEGKDPSSKLQFTFAAVGYDFVKTMKVKIIQGRDFSREHATDSVGYIVNEKALDIFNYKDPIGMPLTFWQTKGTIIGVVEDFHFNSLHNPITPLILRLGEINDEGSALVRTEPGKTKDALGSIEKIWKDMNADFPYTYQFSDQEYQQMYKSEQIVSKLSNAFAFLGIFISSLGLLGLSIFTAEQRTKELGIRKVLGASMVSLFNLLSKELLLLVAVSLVIATPVAWYVMNDWLEDYAYKVKIEWWIFVAAGAISILIAVLTISVQTLKALFENPVKSLRSE
jgi:predicted permease